MVDECKKLRLYVCTWNVGESDPLDAREFETLLHSEEEFDIYAIGFQEIQTGAQETVKSFVHYDDWAKALKSHMSQRNYFLVESVRVQGISISVFALIKHLPHVRFVKTEIERTGVAGAWGNKGGVAVSTVLYGQQVCFLNVHLSAHLNAVENRISDINEIYKEMGFGDSKTVESHDLVLMFGDMNFRIDELSRDFIIETVAKKNYSVLWEKDQLKEQMKKHKLLSEFEEGTLDFDPTYKYDPGTDIYDTSEKQRKPAWTDRILWRIHPEVRLRTASPFTIEKVKESFQNHISFRQSDHKPVTCQFELKIHDAHLRSPVLHMEPEGNWSVDQDGFIKLEMFEGMSWTSKDYIALYKHKLEDFRTYETYTYVPKLRRRRNNSSSGESSDDESSRQVANSNDPNDNIKHVTMKKSLITEPGTYRLGYYSIPMSCLIAVTEPFDIAPGKK